MQSEQTYSAKSKAARGADRAIAAGRAPSATYTVECHDDRFVIVWKCARKIAAGASTPNVTLAHEHAARRAKLPEPAPSMGETELAQITRPPIAGVASAKAELHTALVASVAETAGTLPKEGTKNRAILEAAMRPCGVTVPEMLTMTGWKDPYWRLEPIAAKAGLSLTKTREGGTTRYRVSAA